MTNYISIDGAHGEGGGQIVRSALCLSVLTQQAVRLEHIRAKRPKPGLRPQHLAAVRALGRLCQAHVEGDILDSRTLCFEPTTTVTPGEYTFDVSLLAGTGSAGSVTLLFQALFLPLSLAGASSTLRLIGGTHVAWSPPYQYLTQVYLPLAWQIGLDARLELGRWGWYPRGGGQLTAHIGGGVARADLHPLQLEDRGKLEGVWGISAVSDLPDHILKRQRAQAFRRLRARRINADIDLMEPPSIGKGTMLFLLAQYENLSAGFTGYGRVRYPAERVADDAANGLIDHLASKAALDPHLADQILLPLALTPGISVYSTSEITGHLLTNRWVIGQLLKREILVDGIKGGPGTVTII